MGKPISWIEKQKWNHGRFLRAITVLMLFSFFLIVVLVNFWAGSGIITPERRNILLLQFGRDAGLALIAGLLLGVILLLPSYRRKNWDLHQVVPKYLIKSLGVLLIGQLAAVQFLITFEAYRISTMVIGMAIGFMFAIIAYVGEVEREHSGK